jgi:hypothetical protein
MTSMNKWCGLSLTTILTKSFQCADIVYSEGDKKYTHNFLYLENAGTKERRIYVSFDSKKVCYTIADLLTTVARRNPLWLTKYCQKITRDLKNMAESDYQDNQRWMICGSLIKIEGSFGDLRV